MLLVRSLQSCGRTPIARPVSVQEPTLQIAMGSAGATLLKKEIVNIMQSRIAVRGSGPVQNVEREPTPNIAEIIQVGQSVRVPNPMCTQEFARPASKREPTPRVAKLHNSEKVQI